VGGGPLQPVSMAILYSAFPPDQRGTAVGLFNLSIALGLIIGRFGGFLVEAFNWRMIFYLTIPFGVFSAVMGFFLVPHSGQRRQWSIDSWGILTMGGFLVPLLVALTQGRRNGWDAAYLRGLLILAVVSLIAFVIIELRAKAPVVELRLYKHFNFAMGSAVNFMVTVLFTSSTFLINIFLQQVYQFTPSQVGLLMFPQGIVYGLGSLWSGRLSDYVDPRLPLVLGLSCFALVYYWLGSISALATAAALMGMLCLRSFSFSCVNSPNMLMSLRSLPEDQVRMGTGLFSVARGIAGTFAVALSATFIEHRRALHAMRLAQEQGLLDMPSQWASTGLQHMFESLGEPPGMARLKAGVHLHGLMLEEAAVSAYQDFFLFSAFISLFTLIPGLMRKAAADKFKKANRGA
jgi:DHA2 family multidrug resistance protein